MPVTPFAWVVVCGDSFSALCSLQHGCTFDYVAHDRGVLDKLNPKVVGDKLGAKI